MIVSTAARPRDDATVLAASRIGRVNMHARHESVGHELTVAAPAIVGRPRSPSTHGRPVRLPPVEIRSVLLRKR
jgi:hypothetical protein